MECYTYLRNIQDLLSDGKTPSERRFGEPFLKDQSFRLVHWLNITLFLRRTSQESINLGRKSYLDGSLDTLCTRGEFGRVAQWLQTLRSWKRWTHLKSTRKDSTRRRWTNQICCRRSGTENIHLDTGPPNPRRRSRRFSRRIRRVSSTTSRLISGCQ